MMSPLRRIVWVALLIAGTEALLATWLAAPDASVARRKEEIWTSRVEAMARTTAAVDVLFLGDSTVGAAVDEGAFEAASGLKMLNLGLTGDLVTYGDYAALERYLRGHAPPRAVVLWHTLDVWPRTLNPQLLAFTEPAFPDLVAAMARGSSSTSDPKLLYRWPVRFLGLLLQDGLMKVPSYRHRSRLREAVAAAAPVRFDLEAIALLEPEPPSAAAAQARHFAGRGFEVSADARLWLARCVSLADARGIRVLLARSPVSEEFASQPGVAEFLARSNAVLEELFATHPRAAVLDVTNPVYPADPPPADKDHAGPRGRAFLSRYYAEKVRAALR